MDRRRFLLASLAAGVSPFAMRGALAADAASYAEAFHRASAREPWLRAYEGLDHDVAAPSLRIEGRIPAGLRGTLYRNGPALFERSGIRYHHLFDGDGMVQAFRITDGGVSHEGRFVHTPKFVAEQAQRRFLQSGFGTALQGAPFATGGGPERFNVANTNVVVHARRVLALWEGGSAYELDPRTLETRGAVTWRPDLKGMPFSAHPKVEPDGTMWNMGAIPNSLAIYRIAPDGTLAQAEVLKVPGLVMNHDFAVSRDHLVFVLPETRLDYDKIRGGSAFLDALSFPPEAPMKLLVVDKADLRRQRTFELPAGYLFHFGNAWNDGAGTLRFDYVHHESASVLMEALPGLMRGDTNAMPSRSAASTHVAVDLASGRVRSEAMKDIVEFPRVDPRVVGRRNRHLWLSTGMGKGLGTLMMNAVLRYDVETGRRDAWRYEPEALVEEHVFVADPAASREGAGWLVGCAFDVAGGRTSLNIFDALQLSAGPLARAWLPYGMPPGFHGNFQAA